MKHYAHYFRPGAHLLSYGGHAAGEATAYENTDGSVIVVMSNSMNHDRDISIDVKGKAYEAHLKEHSFNTFVFS